MEKYVLIALQCCYRNSRRFACALTSLVINVDAILTLQESDMFKLNVFQSGSVIEVLLKSLANN